MNELDVFTAALELTDSAARSRFLDAACGGHPEQRSRIDALLRNARDASRYLESPPQIIPATIDQPTERLGTSIGPYKLLQVIGEGGMGTVYMAEQSHPVQRKVALKVIKAGMDSGQVIARFEAERQALALMDHPNIAKVLDAGTTAAGRPYFVMELVKGVPITTYCDENHLPPKARLELFTQVCQAVQHAHHKGVIHRDIKPTNVLVTLYDDKPVPKVIDFGVAKATGGRLTERTMFTGYGQIVGTLEYMSPEQARLNALDIDTRGDIYSLGVLLYELLTGTTPFDKKRLREAAFDEMLRMIREEEPPKPSTRLSTSEGRASIAANRSMEPNKLSGLVRGELDWIVMKALEKDRNRRYETANGFAQDIQRYLHDEHVLACPPSAGYRLRKFARRNKAALATILVLVASLLSGITATTWQAIRATQAESTANREAENAKEQEALAKEAARQEAQQRQAAVMQGKLAKRNEGLAKEQELLARHRYYAAQMNLAQQAFQAGNVPRVLDLLETQRSKAGEPDLRGFEWHDLWTCCHQNLHRVLRGHQSSVFNLCWAPDGKTIATAGIDGTARVFDAISGRETAVLATNPRRNIWVVIISPDGRTIVTGDTRGEIVFWDAATGQRRQEFATLPHWVRSFAFSPDGRYLAAGSCTATTPNHGLIRIWDFSSGEEVVSLEGHGTEIIGLCFSPDGKALASCTGWGDQHDNGRVILWNWQAREKTWQFIFRTARLAFSPDGKRLAASGVGGDDSGGRIHLLDVATGRSLQMLQGHVKTSGIEGLAFLPDGQRLLSGGYDRTIRLWDLSTGLSQVVGAHDSGIHWLAVSPDGRAIATATLEGVCGIWSCKALDATPPLVQGPPLPRAFLDSGKTVFVAGDPYWQKETQGRFVDTQTGEAQPRFSGDVIVVSSDGRHAISHTRGQPMQILDGQSGQARFTLPTRSRPEETYLSGAVFNQDGSHALTWRAWSADPLNLWEVETGRLLRQFAPGGVQSATFSPDGKLVAAAFDFDRAVVWEVETGNSIYEMRFSSGERATAVAFANLGYSVAVASSRGEAHLVDLPSRDVRLVLQGHASNVSGLAFSPDDRRLATASTDGTVKIWDLATGQECASHPCRASESSRVLFSPDGDCLIYPYDDTRLAIKRVVRTLDAFVATKEAGAGYARGSDQADALSQAIEQAGDDPLPWIKRGRYYAEQGQHEKADADFAKAASLTPNELNKFLEAGWWVVGPYPQELKDFCTPEVDPDPSQPVYTIDPKTGLSKQPVAWRSVSTGELGRVDLRAAFNADHFSAYALNVIYSPDERSAMLRIGADDDVRVWLNGRLVHEARPASTWQWRLDRVPVTLRAGRNIVLAKVSQSSGTHSLSLRVADGALDRAFASAEMGLWDEAMQQMRQANPHGIRDSWLAVRFAELLLAAGDVEGYRHHCKWILYQFENPASSFEASHVAWALTLAPDAAPDGERLVRMAEQGLNSKEHYRSQILGYALYRAGRFDEAIQRLGELADVRNPVNDVVLAMARHRRGDADTAQESLKKAKNWYDDATREALAAPKFDLPHWHWNEFVDFQIFYREARALIDGTPAVEDMNAAELLARAREELARRDPLTADFDQALMVAPDQARHWLARGRRLAELGRFDQAAADFAKVLELMPHEVGTHWDTPRKRLCAHLAQWPEMFDKVVELRPGDFDLWIGLARYHHLHNRWEEAAAAYARVDQSHPTDGEWGEYAALLLLAGDDVGYRKLCLRLFEKEKLESPAYLARMAALSPNPPLDPALIVSLAQRGKVPNAAWTRHVLCLAHYRAGAWEAAMRLLQEPNQPRWGHPQASVKLLQAQLNDLLLAMCQFRMGQVEEALKRLTSACEIIDQATCYTAEDPFAASPFDWPPLILLRREAESLIPKQTDPGTPTEKTKSEAMK